MPDLKLLETELTTKANNLLLRLASKQEKVGVKYAYYNADNTVRDFGISTPKKMANHKAGVGWAARAVNTLSDRIVFDGFANDTYGINDLLDSLNAYPMITQVKQDSLIAGCAFIAVVDDQNSPTGKRLLPFTAQEATGYVDTFSGLLSIGLAVTRWQPSKQSMAKALAEPVDYVLFERDYTAIFINKTLVEVVENPTKRCLLQPITHRQSADRPLGKSRITNTARRIIDEVSRVKRRYEIASEFYSIPQRYINGLAEGAEKDSNLDSAIGKVWTITKDEDGEKPDVGQLQQMSINQFSGQKEDLARDFCAETALTMRNLGYETNNPSSAESLSAMSDDLLLEAQNAQAELGEQIKQLAITIRLSINGDSNIPEGLKVIKPVFKPIFQVSIGSAGDAVYKLVQIMPELAGSVELYRMLGLSIKEAEALQQRRNSNNNFMGVSNAQ